MASATLPATVISHARDSPHKPFVEVWDEARGVTQTITFAEMSKRMLSAAAVLRDGLSGRVHVEVEDHVGAVSGQVERGVRGHGRLQPFLEDGGHLRKGVEGLWRADTPLPSTIVGT